MKILITTHYFLPHTGGIEIVAYNEAKQLIEAGHEVTILTSKEKTDEKYYKLEGIKIIKVAAWNFLEKKIGVPYPFFSFKLFKILQNQIKNHDLIHAHGHVYIPSIIAAYLAKKYHKKFYITQHNTFINYKNPFLNFIQNLADKSIGFYTLRSASNIFAVSIETKKYVETIIGKKSNITVLYNGIDSIKYHPVAEKNKLRETLNLPFENFLCFSLRRVTFKNGIDTLLQVAKILKNNKSITIIIGGTGADFNLTKKYIKDNNLTNVSLLGFVAETELANYYAAMNLFILPSKKGEGFPLAVLEAFSSGLPVIATKSGGHTEIIKNNKNGFLVNVDDPKAIAEKIIYFFKKPTQLRKHSLNCRALVENSFSWKQNVEYLLKEYTV